MRSEIKIFLRDVKIYFSLLLIIRRHARLYLKKRKICLKDSRIYLYEKLSPRFC